jgi:hypothetical protein
MTCASSLLLESVSDASSRIGRGRTSGVAQIRDARAEAEELAGELLGRSAPVQILEPAPPAVGEGPWFADAEVEGEGVVSPFGPRELRWETLAGTDAAARGWCAERWLGPYRRLEPLPPGYGGTRAALHLLAERVISPARERANTKIGLRWTLGGFGTPFFGADEQVRVEHGELVVQDRAGVRRAAVASLTSARELAGEVVSGRNVANIPLSVERGAADALGQLYGFATSVLEELRHGAGAELERSRVQLWPEHFDISVELGGEADGRRAGYGVSPGDEQHPLPYLYVVPWGETPADPLWQASGFKGAELGYEELIAAADQRAAALDFFRARLRVLTR